MKLTFEELKDLSNINSELFSVNSLSESYLFCQKLSNEHYENFPVGSFLIPSKIRKHFFAIYSFARLADDISDEFIEIKNIERTKVLNQLSISLENINEISHSTKKNPILLALNDTIEKFKIEKNTLNRLLIAFQKDIDRENLNFETQINDYDDLINYCNFSANPIGELILNLYFENSNINIENSNKICTALQLINFWQDLSIDLKNKRYFIPQELINIYDLNKESLLLPKENINFDKCLSELFNYTEATMFSGKVLIASIKSLRLRIELAIIYEAGLYILGKCRKLGTNLIDTRPKLSKVDYLFIVFKAIIFHRIFI